MKSTLAPLASFLLAVGSVSAEAPQRLRRSLASGDFDFYLLAQSWQPEFCYNKESQYPGCKNPDEWMKTHFTLHGLWPEYTNGEYPQNCNADSFDAKTVENAVGMDDLVKYWPEVEYATSSSKYPSFWEHEWTRHGSCTGLDQATFFSSVVSLLRDGTAQTPSFIQNNVGKTVSTADVRKAYGTNNVVLICTSSKYLSQVYTCWAKDSNNIPTKQMACPSSVLKEDTCKGSSVVIQSFSS
ncbi:hypothetical protein Poli38472_012719 [Pythium oligandrum]|uniref:Uncharacterized protein n=1 Tax=Pythium oligandrum TaxID=41045 RepID=A0A8K1FKA0_PYTOL|nr:hypothetical protein Poli38472_012719 [Pythium oligandrum]|eukprot:TMW61528.1 hypothetical protein Poli38472_012719 [Pythium oligandrum]